MKIPPKELEESFRTLFDSVLWHFTHDCKKHGISPDKCLAMILTCWLSMFKKQEFNPQMRADIVVDSVNQALVAMEKDL